MISTNRNQAIVIVPVLPVSLSSLYPVTGLHILGQVRQGEFEPFGPKEPTPGRRKRSPPRFEFLGAIGLLLGIFGVIGFLIFKFSIFIYYVTS